MPKPFLKEFRGDAVTIARNREPDRRLSRSLPTSVSPSPACATGRAKADVEDGLRRHDPADNTELREAKKWVRLLEQENEVLRRAAAYLSQANLSAR